MVQADVTGAEITLGGPSNDLYNMLSGNLFLTGGLAIDYIEFALTSGASGTIDFTITGSDGTTTFLNQLIGEGNTFFAFNTTGASTITNVMFTAVLRSRSVCSSKSGSTRRSLPFQRPLRMIRKARPFLIGLQR